jgi:hypothetical protein
LALTGEAKTRYMRDYMRRRRSPRVQACDFCGEDAAPDRMLIHDCDSTVFICEHCIALAAATVAERRR